MPRAAIASAAYARLQQIVQNFRQSHTGQLSLISAGLNAVGAAARVFTTLKTPETAADTMMLLGFSVSVVLNGLLVLQIFIYWKRTSEVVKKQKKA